MTGSCVCVCIWTCLFQLSKYFVFLTPLVCSFMISIIAMMQNIDNYTVKNGIWRDYVDKHCSWHVEQTFFHLWPLDILHLCVFTDVSYVPCQHYMAAGGAKVECKRSGFTTSECITLIKYACRHLTYTTVHYSYIATLDPVFNSFFF